MGVEIEEEVKDLGAALIKSVVVEVEAEDKVKAEVVAGAGK